jgi:hypothetical protein
VDPKAVNDYIVEELGRGANRNDVIMALCQQLGLSWPEAEKAVVMAENVNRKAIAARQSPFLLLIGIATVIVGCIVLAYGVYRLSLGAFLSRTTIGAILTGIAMIIGGGWGSWKAIAPMLS